MTSARPYSILITDDDRTARETLRDIVEPAGFRTLLAGSGEEAIDILCDQEVHLVLMDMHLPRMTGLETLDLARQIKGLLLPTILMSGEHDEELLRKALSAHVFCVLAKPVNRNIVIHVVHRVLEKFY